MSHLVFSDAVLSNLFVPSRSFKRRLIYTDYTVERKIYKVMLISYLNNNPASAWRD
jgi:hypothetical protein